MRFFDSLVRSKKEIDENKPSDTGFVLFFQILIREFWNLCTLNLVFLLFCIPVFTIFPAFTALNKVVVLMLRDQPVYVFYEFKKTFKAEFKSSLSIGLLFLSLMSLICFAMYFYFHYVKFLMYLLAALLCYILMAGLYLFSQLACLDLSWTQLIKNSLILPVLAPFRTLISLFLLFLFLSLQILFFPQALPITLCFGISITVFVSCFFIWGNIQKYALSS